MDFVKFLETGELSDITVCVDSKDFKLHKFPLYAHSKYFRALAQGQGSLTAAKDGRVQLPDFPGGSDTFQLVARHCYGVPVTITNENVIPLRCAAEYLQMRSTSPSGSAPKEGDCYSVRDGGLAGLTDKYLDEVLTAARVGQRLDVVCDIIDRCRSIGVIAEQAHVIERCIRAIVDNWIVATKYIR